MAKKDFRGGFDSLLRGVGQEPTRKEKAPQEPEKAAEPTSSATSTERRKGHCTRATFVIDDMQLRRLRQLSYWSRESQKDILSNALAEYIDKYEAVNGPLKGI